MIVMIRASILLRLIRWMVHPTLIALYPLEQFSEFTERYAYLALTFYTVCSA